MRAALSKLAKHATLAFPAVGAAALLATFAWSCSDPVHNARVDALGGEASGVPAGPLHRPGKPCLTCHGTLGPASLELSVAGTIYQTAEPGSAPAVGATVTVYDATQSADGGAPHTAVTNAAGNFFVTRSEWSPVFPLHDISITAPGLGFPVTMHTNVGRDGSCGSCHFEPKGPTSHGPIYLVLTAADLPGATP
jgi:hypothetical protein